jgi:hypothetical protein
MDAERAAWERLRALRREIDRDATELQLRWHEVKRSAISEWGGVIGLARELGRMVTPRPGGRPDDPRRRDADSAEPPTAASVR